MAINVTIKISGGETFVVEVELSMTILELKGKCADRAGATPENQRLIFKGRIVKDEDTLESLKVEDGNTIHLVRSGVKRTSPPPSVSGTQSESCPLSAPTGMPGTSNVTPPTFTPDAFPFPQSGQFNPEMLNQMMQGAGGFGGMPGMGGIPGVDDFNPQTAAALFNNPMIQDMMQQIANNPQLFKDIVSSNPMLQPMVQQNPMLSYMMNNPELLRNMMRPGVLQAGLQLHQSMQQQPQSAGANVGNPLMSAGGYPGFAFPTSMPADTRPPEERYAFQLQTLQEMGFTNRDENISVLNLTNGDISAAISRLLEARGNPSV
ncbi:Ubiquitin family protein [Babesia bovis T2Bo]|uniref:Ubiquitin domain containing protein family n=1 Tax=Babesia bovis TaxID=5865 RepID=A7ASK4_BABBO|nr:Ubiquitin family protein [Babesia bovis T2Bo]EDO07523.1 Ubiquitin family protein [Babesia bovis T2Bo]|eukprot:XP_001611091.1 ubiquitin domain containing protein family [Babesia bovis T2Bo]